MAKTNFTKVESILEEGLRKITVDHFLDLADIAAGIGKKATKKEEAKRIAKFLERSLAFLYRKDHEIYKKLKLKRKKVQQLIENPEKEFDTLKKIKDRVNRYKKALPKSSNADLVEQERVKHIDKRYNVKDGWLPLK